MAQQQISKPEQVCVSDCIFDHWSEHSQTPPERREAEYEQCLTNCRICS